MEEFAKYGFNKSHSAAYALVSYQTAWLKAHYPSGFMAAVLSADMHNTDKVVTLIDECRRMQLAIVPPDVNVSQYKFTVNDLGQIVYGLGAIKGLGEGPIEAILESRKEGEPYKNLFEFCKRVDLKKLNRRSMEAIIRAGALDKMGPDRATLMASLSDAMRYAEQENKNQDLGIMDMFGAVEEDTEQEPEWTKVKSWSDDERLNGEKETLGLYLTGHPIDQYLDEISHFVSCRIADVKPGNSKESRSIVAGLVIAMRVMKNKRGDKMAFLTLDDKSGRLEISIFSDTYEEYKDQLIKDSVLVVEGDVSIDDFSGGLKMVTRKVFSIGQARENYARLVSLQLDQGNLVEGFAQQLQQTLQPYREGTCRVRIQYNREGAHGRLYLGEGWNISPKPELIKQLEQLCGENALTVHYR